MKMLAQQGHGPSDKIRRGIMDGVIGGAILSLRYVRPAKMAEKIDEWIPSERTPAFLIKQF